MSYAVYLLCAITSLVCTVLLLRNRRRGKSELITWTAFCFLALTLSNILLFVDLVVVPNYDLQLLRNAISFAGGSLLLFGLIRSST
jgi:hypothetical protein